MIDMFSEEYFKPIKYNKNILYNILEKIQMMIQFILLESKDLRILYLTFAVFIGLIGESWNNRFSTST